MHVVGFIIERIAEPSNFILILRFSGVTNDKTKRWNRSSINQRKKLFSVCPAEYKFPVIYSNYLEEVHGISIASLP